MLSCAYPYDTRTVWAKKISIVTEPLFPSQSQFVVTWIMFADDIIGKGALFTDHIW